MHLLFRAYVFLEHGWRCKRSRCAHYMIWSNAAITYFKLRCRGNDLALATEVAQSLRMSPSLMRLAHSIVRNITGGRQGFNGVHLRTEGDAKHWMVGMGGEKVCLSNTYSTFKA